MSFWSDEESERLRQRWDEGAKLREIAVELNRTLQSVAHQRKRMGLQVRNNFGGPEYSNPWTEVDIRRLKSLHAKGVLYKQIAITLGRHVSRVKEMAMILNLPKRRGDKKQKRPSVRISVSQVMYDAIARKAARNHQTVASYLRTLVEKDLG